MPEKKLKQGKNLESETDEDPDISSTMPHLSLKDIEEEKTVILCKESEDQEVYCEMVSPRNARK